MVVAASPVPAHTGSIIYYFWKLKILEGNVLFNNMILYNKLLFLNLYEKIDKKLIDFQWITLDFVLYSDCVVSLSLYTIWYSL